MTTLREAAQQAIALIASARRRREEMTALREAAQQALEALEAFMHDSPRPYDAMRGQAAMGALRAALAEPVEEPVAYIHRQGNHWEVSELHLSDDEKARGWTEEPLYTAPPQRKPLTDEKIVGIFETPELAGTHFPSPTLKAIAVARAIERAHGIGETK